MHISALTNKFISDPREVVKAGDIVKVKVLEVDVARKRISFTMRLDDTPSQSNNAGGHSATGKGASSKGANNQRAGKAQNKGSGRSNQGGGNRNSQPQNSAMGNAFADAFAKAKK